MTKAYGESMSARRHGEGGTILLMTAIAMFGIFVCLGLAIDISRFYALRADLQNAADAASLAAARELNSGAGGINDAVTRANEIANEYGFARNPITVDTVEFSVNLDGTYVDQATAAAAPENIRFVRVTTTAVNVPVLFAARVLGAEHGETGRAVAGMSVGINNICDFFPIAVALTDPNPAHNTVMTLNFTQGTGNSATLANQDYIILEVPDINGNGAPETAVLSAGLTNICASINETINFHMTPSANINNGPRQISDGVNTRFNMYANGYGNALQPGPYPPDSNIQNNITFDQYINRTAVTAPNPNAPGQDARRILIVPIVAPGTYSPPNTIIIRWAAFFLKRSVTVTNPCSQAGNCARLEVEWIDENLVLGRGFYDPNEAESSLTIPVLYR